MHHTSEYDPDVEGWAVTIMDTHLLFSSLDDTPVSSDVMGNTSHLEKEAAVRHHCPGVRLLKLGSIMTRATFTQLQQT